jgi:transcriptional regulator with XRE-family HTH domain
MDALGGFIRAQRQLANLSLREMAAMTSVSNAYLSQIERGLHQPSLKVLRSIAEALDLSTEQMLSQAGWPRVGAHTRADTNGHAGAAAAATDGAGPGDTEAVIRRDPRLTPPQREALISVYRSFLAGSDLNTQRSRARSCRLTARLRSRSPGRCGPNGPQPEVAPAPGKLGERLNSVVSM